MVNLLKASICMAAACNPAAFAIPDGQLPEVGALTAYPASDRYGAPVIELGGDSPLVISFDLLEPERRYLRYTITHCDASWKPDMLQPIEFTNGFNEGRIDDYAYSQGTLTPYVNYRISLPNPDITPTVSGNYLLFCQIGRASCRERVTKTARGRSPLYPAGLTTTTTDRINNSK